MITEDYVSFEIAKLLIEKGFNEPTLAYAYSDDMIGYYSKPRITDTLTVEAGRIPLPTLQMAMKWLREVHNVHIGSLRSPKGYHITIETIPLGVVKYITKDIVGANYVDSYEQGCETAIKYCLENLI